jgi:hypothetical protein
MPTCIGTIPTVRLGINTAVPSDKLHVNGGNILLNDVAGQTPYQIRGYSNGSSLWLISGSATTSQIVVGTGHDWDRQVAIDYTPGTVGAFAGVLNIGQLNKNNANFTHGITRFYTNGTDKMSISSNGDIALATKVAFRSSDAWLRLNPTNAFTNGVYVANFFRSDGGIASGAIGGLGAGTITANDIINSNVGYRISNAAASGTYLRGNGTNFVSSTIQPADIPYGNSSTGGPRAQGNFGQFQPHGTYTDFNTVPAYWGWNYVQNNINAPNTISSQWYREVVSLGDAYPARGAGGYSMELAFPRDNPATAGVWMRTVENGTIGGWTRIDAGSNNGNFIQNQNAAAQSANWWVSGNGVSNGTLSALSMGVSNTASTTGRGLSLYGGPTAGQPSYGIMFAGTGTFGTHGGVTSDWATYFTMNDNTARGWVFRRGSTNVASINGAGDLSLNGVVRGIQGYYPANNAIRMTPNMHLNTPVGNAIIVNWDNGAVGGTVQQFRVGNGQGTDQFYVRADGGAFGRIWYDLDNSGYYVDANGTANMFRIQANDNIYNAGWYRGGTADNGHVRVYGNSRTVVFRTDGTTAYGNNGAYPFIWNYGGDDASQRRMILNSNGDVWTNTYGWLHDGFIRNNGSGDYQIASNSGATGYSNASLELRETNFGGAGQQPPRLGFHWGGVVASQISIESDGTIAIRDNPGTSYEKFKCRTIRTNGIIEPSDERLKNDISEISGALGKVMAMRGVTYHWKKELPQNNGLSEKLQYGLIAQELEAIIPELVDTDSEGWKAVEYSHLVPVLIEAIKTQQAEIESQRNIIANHATDMTILKEQARKLEAKFDALVSPSAQVIQGKK